MRTSEFEKKMQTFQTLGRNKQALVLGSPRGHRSTPPPFFQVESRGVWNLLSLYTFLLPLLEGLVRFPMLTVQPQLAISSAPFFWRFMGLQEISTRLTPLYNCTTFLKIRMLRFPLVHSGSHAQKAHFSRKKSMEFDEKGLRIMTPEGALGDCVNSQQLEKMRV